MKINAYKLSKTLKRTQRLQWLFHFFSSFFLLKLKLFEKSWHVLSCRIILRLRHRHITFHLKDLVPLLSKEVIKKRGLRSQNCQEVTPSFLQFQMHLFLFVLAFTNTSFCDLVILFFLKKMDSLFWIFAFPLRFFFLASFIHSPHFFPGLNVIELGVRTNV